MIICGMTLMQAVELERVFAKLTEHGWVVPDWLVELENEIAIRMVMDGEWAKRITNKCK